MSSSFTDKYFRWKGNVFTCPCAREKIFNQPCVRLLADYEENLLFVLLAAVVIQMNEKVVVRLLQGHYQLFQQSDIRRTLPAVVCHCDNKEGTNIICFAWAAYFRGACASRTVPTHKQAIGIATGVAEALAEALEARTHIGKHLP